MLKLAPLITVTLADMIADRKDHCTSMVFGKLATAHGHPVATHANDCADCDSRVAYVPARAHNENSQRPVYDGIQSLYPRVVSSERSEQYMPVNGQKNSVPLGYVPQADHTHALYEIYYPLISDAGVGIGESTTSGKAVLSEQLLDHTYPNSNVNGTALFTIGELMKVAMEQESNARDTIKNAGALCQEFGFGGEEWGTTEAVSVVDNEEAWIMEITGAGSIDSPSCLWVAQRVPDDHVAIITNNMVIKEVVLTDPENYMFSDNLISRTIELGLFPANTSAITKFPWYDTVAVTIPLPQYSAMRTWRVFSQLAPSMGDWVYNPDPLSYPFSVKVDAPVSIRQIMDLHRDHYQGTEFDMTEGVLAGPYNSPNLEMPGLPRSISIARTSYTAIVAPQGELSKVWVAMDQPTTSVFVPFYASALRSDGGRGKFDPSFGSPYGPAQQVFNRTTAWWAFDFVSNWMNINYRNMSAEEVFPARDALQEWVFEQVDHLEKSLTHDKVENSIKMADTQTGIQHHVTKTWWDLADTLIVRYNDGFFNFGKYYPERAVPILMPKQWLNMVGYKDDFYKPGEHWVKPAGMGAYNEAKTQVLSNSQDTVVLQSSNWWGVLIGVIIAFLGGVWFERKKNQQTDTSNGYYQKL
jgi:dipeptidase